MTPDELEAVNEAMKTSLGGNGDGVQNSDRIMRLAGTCQLSAATQGCARLRTGTDEAVRHRQRTGVSPRRSDQLADEQARPVSRTQQASWHRQQREYRGKSNGTGAAPTTVPAAAWRWHRQRRTGPRKRGRTDAEIAALLERSRRSGNWHIPILKAIASMIGRNWPNSLIRLICAPYCEDRINDADLDDMINRARKKWRRPDEEAEEPNANPDADVKRLNAEYAVLPIGGKTRVVKFGELDEFPGRETIVMTQTIRRLRAAQQQVPPHLCGQERRSCKAVPMGTYWIRSPKRRQYDGGMAFMPQHDGDVGDRLNLWRGFGVKAIKPDGKSGAEACAKFLDFMRDIICSGNEAHFDYLLKREATILQKRIRSEVALGLQTKEEGCGKGFYEKTMGRLLGTHAMQVANPKHIIGNFNPHLETLLRLTADEALFVGNHEHRNALFGLITEPNADDRAEGLRRLQGQQLSEHVDRQQLRPLPAGQRYGATLLHPDRVGRAQAGLTNTLPACRKNSTTAATRRCSITCCTRSISRTSTSARCRRRKGCGSNGIKACRRWKRGGASCWRPARCGEPIRRSRTGRSATAISA